MKTFLFSLKTHALGLILLFFAGFFSQQGFGQTTIINYNFNSGSTFAGLSAAPAAGITCSVSAGGGNQSNAVFGSTSSVSTSTDGSAFTQNSTAGNSLYLTPNNDGNTPYPYWLFTIGGSSLSNYSNFKLYFQANRDQGGTADVNILYSTNGGSSYSSLSDLVITNKSQWYSTGALSVPGVSNPSSLIFKLVINSIDQGTGNVYIDNFQVQGVSSLAPPTLTAAAGATVDASLNVTFTDNASWRSAITSVQYGATTLVLNTDYTISSGKIVLIPGNNIKTAGTQNLTVTATGYTNDVISQTIGAGAFKKLQVLLPGESAAAGTTSGKTGTPSAETAGTSFSITVNAVDNYWNIVSSGAGSAHSVAITSTDGAASLPVNAALVSGTKNFTITLKTIPSQTITATDQTPTVGLPNTSSSVTVNASSAAQIAINGGNGQSATAGSAVATAPSVIVKDAYGNVVSGASVSFAIATGGGSLTGANTTTSSTGIATVGSWTLGGAAGSNTMTATVSGVSPITFSATGTAGGFVKLQILLPGETAAPGTTTGKTGSPTAITAGNSLNAIVNAVDANWNIVSSSDVIKIASSDGQAVLPVNSSLSSGTKTFSVTLKTSNSQTITSSDVTSSSKTASTSPAVTVNAASLSTFSFANISTQSADVAFAITVTAQDAYGNALTTANGNSFSGTVTLSTTISGGTVSPTSLSFSNGSYSGNITAYLAGSQALKVLYNPGSFTGTSNPFTVSAFASTASDYFRTGSSGDWAATSPYIWQGSHDGNIWYTATAYPTSAASGITVQNVHSITITTPVSSSSLSINGVININGGSGNLTNSGTITGASMSTFIINSGGTYTHAVDGGTVPTAKWDAASTCVISGVSGNNGAPTGLGQSFGNFTWNSNLSGNIIDLNSTLKTVNGNFTFNPSTSSNSLRLATDNALILTIGGNFVISSTAGSNGSTLRLTDGNASPVINVTGDLKISNGSTLDFSAGDGFGTINLKGNFSATGASSLNESAPGSGFNSGNAPNGIVNFTGTNQNLTNTITGDASNVDFNIKSGSIVTLLSSFALNNNNNSLSGNLSTLTVLNGGTLICGTSFNITGLSTQIFRGFTYINSTFNVQNGGNLQVASATGITLAGSSTGNVQTAVRTFDPAANYTYNGTNAQFTGSALPTSLTGSLTINNSNGVTLSNAGQVANGTTTVAAGGIFTLPASATTTLGGAINTNTTGVINPGTSSALVINGSGTISTPVLFGSGIFSSFTLNRTGAVVTLGSALNTAALTLTNGKIDASAYVLTLTTNAVIGGFSASNYVITGNGSGNGYLQINNLAANTQYTFPVGTAANYLPAYVKPATGGLNWTAKVFSPSTTNGSYSGSPYTGSALQSIVNAVWDIAPTPNTPTTATITLNWVSALEGSVFTSYADSYIGISHYTSGAWQGGTATGGASHSSHYVTSTFTSFSPFGIGSINNPLPVVLVGFDAVLNNNKTVDVSWTTEQEVNSNYFEIERSADGTHWQTIGTVQAKGNSSLPSNYGYTDETPLDGINYYRLKMVNIAGDFGYTTIRIIRTMQVKGINIFPNPARNYVNVSVSQAATDLTIRLVNQSGQVLQTAKINAGGSSTISLQVQNYPQGTYLLQITSADGTQQTSKVVIMR